MAFTEASNGQFFCGPNTDIVVYRAAPAQGSWVSKEAFIAYYEYMAHYEDNVQMPLYREKISEFRNGKKFIWYNG